jgi:hypothetical protein
MTKSDQNLINERYEQIQEGLFDRLKARGAQALGTVKGAGQQIAGKARQVAGGALSKTAELGGRALGVDASQGGLAQKGAQLTQAGKKQVGAGQRAGEEAKYQSYINNTVQTIIGDLNKLGMSVKDENKLATDLNKVLLDNLKYMNVHGQTNLPNSSGKTSIGSKIVNVK